MKDVKLWDLENLPDEEVTYLCKPWIPKEGVSIIGGAGGMGKSWLALDLSLALTLGEPWLGYPTRQSKVLYLDEDGPEVRALARYKRLTKGRGVEVNDPRLVENFIFAPCQDLKIDIDIKLARIVVTISYHKPDLVIFDALVAFHSLPENESHNASRLMRGILGTLAREAKASILVLHHHNKPDSRYPQKATSKLRGSTELINSVNCIYEVENNQISTIRNQLEENKNWGPPTRFVIRETIPGGSIIEPIDLVKLKKGGMTYRELEKASGVSKSALQRELKSFV